MEKNSFLDGLYNVFNQIINRRNPLTQNKFVGQILGYDQQRAIFRTGLGSKIVRIKAGYALKDTLQFEISRDSEVYKNCLEDKIKLAAQYMIAFGRGCVVIHTKGDDLTTALKGPVDPVSVRLSVFSGDMVTVGSVSFDLNSPLYMKPIRYSVRGTQIHHSRVVDFTYVRPTEYDLPKYYYGGISEFELIYNQLINDGIVERASSSILEKNSSWVYKITGFKEAMRSKRDEPIIKYISKIEDMRSIYGAAIIDAEDDVESLSQVLSNLADVDQITLRRLAMVTGIPVSILVGENVRGLNASGDSERSTFQDTEETLQSDYLLAPINELMKLCNLGLVSFRDNQGETPEKRILYDKTAIENALILHQMGEDYGKYLEQHNVIEPDNWEDFWKDKDEA